MGYIKIDMLLSCRLVRYLYPTDEELRALAGVPKDKSKGKKSGRNNENGKTAEAFHIPRNLDIKVFYNFMDCKCIMLLM